MRWDRPGAPGRVPQSERGGGWRDDRPSSGPQAPRNGCPQHASAEALGGGKGSRTAVATPPISATHRGWGHGAWPRPPKRIAKPWKPLSREN